MRFSHLAAAALLCACALEAGAFEETTRNNVPDSVIFHNYPVPDDGVRLKGADDTYLINPDGVTTLEYVAAHYKLGLSNLIEANPQVDPIVPLQGTRLIVPGRLLLPDTVHEGIIVNSPEMRLYYYHDGSVDVFPIGIGEVGKGTPLKWVTKVERKRERPTWTPTAKMRAEAAAAGEPLPAVWPAGPDNPMGLYAMYVGKLFAIHGTNADFGIGLRVSHGCVRLRHDDIAYLFNNVPVGTRVEFINRPVKYSKEPDGNIFIEVHQPLSRNSEEFAAQSDQPFEFTEADREFFADPAIDQELLQQALTERSGRVVWLNPPRF